MAGDLARQMIERHRNAARPKQRASITLDQETLRLAEKWSVGSIKDTVAMFAKVADEAMTAAKAEEDGGQDMALSEIGEEEGTLGDRD